MTSTPRRSLPLTILRHATVIARRYIPPTGRQGAWAFMHPGLARARLLSQMEEWAKSILPLLSFSSLPPSLASRQFGMGIPLHSTPLLLSPSRPPLSAPPFPEPYFRIDWPSNVPCPTAKGGDVRLSKELQPAGCGLPACPSPSPPVVVSSHLLRCLR